MPRYTATFHASHALFYLSCDEADAYRDLLKLTPRDAAATLDAWGVSSEASG